MQYLRVLFHSSKLLLTFCCAKNKEIWQRKRMHSCYNNELLHINLNCHGESFLIGRGGIIFFCLSNWYVYFIASLNKIKQKSLSPGLVLLKANYILLLSSILFRVVLELSFFSFNINNDYSLFEMCFLKAQRVISMTMKICTI